MATGLGWAAVSISTAATVVKHEILSLGKWNRFVRKFDGGKDSEIRTYESAEQLLARIEASRHHTRGATRRSARERLRALMPDASDARLQLTPTQQRLYQALVELRPDLAEWYRAAIAVINDTSLPDRLSLAAHALREVMEKLPGDGVSVDRGVSLPQKVSGLRPPWDKAQDENQRCGGAWQGEIGAQLREFLAAMQSFFDGQEDFIKSRQAFAEQFLAILDAGAGLPKDLQRTNAKQWMNFQGYFISVAHHGSVKEPEFLARVAGFETFIATRLKPRPTEDFATIDALLEEG